jgi:two-component system, OmpR family, sensor histidine kinase CpxA
MPNLNLSGRIFLSFWSVLLVIMLASGIIFYNDERPPLPPDAPAFRIAHTLGIKLLQEPQGDVRNWFATLPEKDRRHIFVLIHDDELLQRPLPPPLQKIAERLTNQRPFVEKRRENGLFIGRLIWLTNGESVKILLNLRDPHPDWRNAVLENITTALLCALFASILISFFLARSIANPIRQLRQVSNDIAQGKLNTRLPEKVLQRNDDIGLLARDFEHMTRALENSLSSQRRLLHDISHELRSPVARLQIALALARKKETEQQIKDFARIEYECEEINQIIATMLNLPLYELEPHIARQEQVDIKLLLTDLCQDMRFEFPNGNLVLTVTSEECIVQGNSLLLRSALSNVIKNALHHSPVNMSVAVQLDCSATQLLITIRDHGAGLPESELELIFKPFYRSSFARDRQSGGHGLGLTLAKRAVDIHTGNIQAHNAAGGGLLIQINLPRL